MTFSNPIKRGMSIANGLEAPGEGAWGYRFEDWHIQVIADAGFDTVRVPCNFSLRTDQYPPFTVAPAFMDRVAHVVTLGLQAGLQVVVDLHHYDDPQPYPTRHRTRIHSIWEQLAIRFKDAPDTLFFEILNHGQDWSKSTRLENLSAELVQIIRAVHPTRWIIIGGAVADGMDSFSKVSIPADPKTILSFNYFEPVPFTHQGAHFLPQPPPMGRVWGAQDELGQVQADIQAASQIGMTVGRSVVMGEFGVYEKVTIAERLKWIEDVRRMAEGQNMGWLYWGFANDFPAYDLERREWFPGILDALLAP